MADGDIWGGFMVERLIGIIWEVSMLRVVSRWRLPLKEGRVFTVSVTK